MARTKINLTNDNVFQNSGDTLNLSGNTTIKNLFVEETELISSNDNLLIRTNNGQIKTISQSNLTTIEYEKYEVNSDTNSVILAKYETPVQLNIKFFNGVSSAVYRTKLDDGIDTYTARNDLDAVNTYLASLADGTDVVLELATNATETTYIRIMVNRLI